MDEKIVASFDKTKIAFNHFKKEGRNIVIIICHGFSMAKDERTFIRLSRDLFKRFDVIAMDQRGHGNSGGSFSFTSKEHKDIKAIIKYAQRYYQHIHLIGFSLGAASAIIEVAENKNVAGLIAVSAPMSFERIENHFLNKDAFIAGIQKLGPHTLKLRIGNMFAKKIRPIDVIDKISPIPILIIHGEKDPIVFRHHAQALYKKARQPKELVIIKDGLHAEELFRRAPKDFNNIVINFILALKCT
jgi:pimeloyl-ACP methyl ester carboxylesterase